MVRAASAADKADLLRADLAVKADSVAADKVDLHKAVKAASAADKAGLHKAASAADKADLHKAVKADLADLE